MGFKLTVADRDKLKGVHKDLVRVIELAAERSDRPFRVLEGLRTIERQRQLVAKGASKTLNSRHLTGHAVDIAPLEGGQVSWSWSLYHPLAKIVKEAAADLRVPIEWGGDWSKFRDGPHWQLPWAKYPAKTDVPEVEAAPRITEKSDQRVAVEKGGIVAAGTTAGITIGAEPLAKTAEVIVTQQGELTSGSLVRIAIAALVIGLTIFAVVRASQ